MQLTIELEATTDRFRTGDTVRGLVVAVVDGGAITCQELRAELQWRTHGKGNAARHSWSQQLFRGELAPGRYRYPFEFVIGAGPLTYHGRLVSVEWYVWAGAEVAWALDPTAEQTIEVVPGEVRPVDPEGAEQARLPEQLVELLADKRRHLAGCAVLAALPFVAGIALTAVGVLHHFGMIAVDGDGWVAFVIGPLLLVSGGVPLARGLWHAMARRKLGQPRIVVGPSEVRPGDTVDVRVELHPQDAVTLNGLSARLEGREVAVHGRGRNRRTATGVLANGSEVTIASTTTLRGGSPQVLHGRLQVPAGAAYSFEVNQNAVRWRLVVTADIPWGPDWTDAATIVISPWGPARADSVRGVALEAPVLPPPPSGDAALAVSERSRRMASWTAPPPPAMFRAKVQPVMLAVGLFLTVASFLLFAPLAFAVGPILLLVFLAPGLYPSHGVAVTSAGVRMKSLMFDRFLALADITGVTVSDVPGPGRGTAPARRQLNVLTSQAAPGAYTPGLPFQVLESQVDGSIDDLAAAIERQLEARDAGVASSAEPPLPASAVTGTRALRVAVGCLVLAAVSPVLLAVGLSVLFHFLPDGDGATVEQAVAPSGAGLGRESSAPPAMVDGRVQVEAPPTSAAISISSPGAMTPEAARAGEDPDVTERLSDCLVQALSGRWQYEAYAAPLGELIAAWEQDGRAGIWRRGRRLQSLHYEHSRPLSDQLPDGTTMDVVVHTYRVEFAAGAERWQIGFRRDGKIAVLAWAPLE